MPNKSIKLVIACFAMLSATNSIASSFNITMYGQVTTVDQPLKSKFSTGDSFQFGFTIDEQNGQPFATLGTGYTAKNVYFSVGNNYSASSTTDAGVTFFNNYFAYASGNGFRFEKNNMTAPAVNGLQLTDTYIDLGFNKLFPSTQIYPSQVLPISSQNISEQNSSLSFSTSPNYQYVRFNISSIQIQAVPVPSAAWLFGSGLLGLSGIVRRKSKGANNHNHEN